METNSNPAKKTFPGWAVLLIILVVAWLNGLVYLWLLPSWQHYDEPNHFEYAWLIANWKKLPQPGESDPVLGRQVFDSMWANDFFGDPIYKPDIPPGQSIPVPGYTQLDDPPIYYILAAVPILLTGSQSIEVQLYAARFASLLLLLVTVVAAWGIARELTPEKSPLRWALPLTVALFPTLVELMTAVNDDAGGIALFSLFLWASVRLIQRGFNWLVFLGAAAAAGLTYFTRNTAMPALLFLPLVLILSLLKGRVRWLVWGVTVASVVLFLVVFIESGDAAFWYRSTSQNDFTRQQDNSAVVGSHVIQLDTSAQVTPNWMSPLFQPITSWEPRNELGNNLTFGVWMWADRPIEASLPVIYVNRDAEYRQLVQLDETPRFFAYHVAVPEKPRIRIWVNLEPSPSVMGQGATIYYDGMTLARGRRSLDQPPVFQDEQATKGIWQGEGFKNLIRNGSGEIAGLRVKPNIDDLGTKILPDDTRISFIFSSLMDYSKNEHLLGLTVQRLTKSFWGAFAWGNVILEGAKPYRLLGILSFIGIAGYIFWLIMTARKNRQEIPVHSIVLFLATIVFIWSISAIRGLIYFSRPDILLPVARYAFPTVIPVLYFLVTGWTEILFGISAKLRIPNSIPAIIFAGMLLAFNVYAIWSISQYFAVPV